MSAGEPVSALRGYPENLLRLVAELRAEPPTGEPRASCGRCPLLPEHSGADPSKPWAFDPATRCCTYHPSLPNFLAGRALLRGGTGAALILRRLHYPQGVGPTYLRPPPELAERYAERARTGAFGRDEQLRCPYWVGGEESCGIWLDRNRVCRTWFCKHEQGRAGWEHWQAVRKALGAAEDILARYCTAQGEPPGEGAEPQAWASWYASCARRVHGLDDDEIDELRGHVAERAREAVYAVPGESGPVPEVLEPSVGDFDDDGEVVHLIGYSQFDGVDAPRSVFRFLSLLDGERPWREALRRAEEHAGQPLGEHLVEELYRIGALRDPEDEALEPIAERPGFYRRDDGSVVYAGDVVDLDVG